MIAMLSERQDLERSRVAASGSATRFRYAGATRSYQVRTGLPKARLIDPALACRQRSSAPGLRYAQPRCSAKTVTPIRSLFGGQQQGNTRGVRHARCFGDAHGVRRSFNNPNETFENVCPVASWSKPAPKGGLQDAERGDAPPAIPHTIVSHPQFVGLSPTGLWTVECSPTHNDVGIVRQVDVVEGWCAGVGWFLRWHLVHQTTSALL